MTELRTIFSEKFPYIIVAILAVTVIAATLSLDRFNNRVYDGESLECKSENLLSLSLGEMLKNHPETSPHLDENMSWIKVDQFSTEGYTVINYVHGDWSAVISYPRAPDAGCELKVEHEKGIIWEGTIEGNTVKETRYEFNETINSDEQDIKYLVMVYVKEKHPEVAKLINTPGNMSWVKTESKILEGYSEFTYSCQNWSITIGYAITAPEYKLHEVKLENKEHGVKWTGVVKDGEVTEKSYMKED